MNTKKLTVLLTSLALLTATGLAKYTNPDARISTQPQARLLSLVTDEPAFFWNIWWAGAGNLGDFTISNTLQGGTFARHPADEHEYRGLIPVQSINLYPGTRGRCSEYPTGSEQFYTYAWGLWVGSRYPVGEDTVYNVSKGAFNSDLGGMAAPEMSDGGGMQNIADRGLYFSDMTIPEGYGFDGEGGRLFPQYGGPLDYQVTWPFTDTLIGKRREAIGMPGVEKGDIISGQDTYACAGDWIPAREATCIWIRPTGPYDIRGQGLRIEQRTYSWNYEYNDSYIFINYKIRNMNEFSLDSVYISFFMDNDIGEGGQSPGDDGFWDDLIGFDEELNMGYTYDANGSEEGWVTPAGYVGAVLLETPEDIGLTGFETWQNGHEVDFDGEDSLKYHFMASREFVVWEKPNDVRMLLNCGPIDELKPGAENEIDITIAVIVAYSFDELREKAEAAKIQFENGYFGYAPPPSPSLAVIPGDSVIHLTWGSQPENYVDPMSELPTFEGYRLYRSLSGLAETWQLLADYDLADSENPDTAIAEHTSGPSKAEIDFLGVYQPAGSFKEPEEYGFQENTYTLTFKEDKSVYPPVKYYLITDKTQKVLSYNSNATQEGGYCVLRGLNGTPIRLDDATRAEGDVTFTGPENTLIPEGTIVATDSADPVTGYVEFLTTEDGTIDSGEDSVDVEVEAVVAGKFGNVYAGAVTQIVKSDADLSDVTVTNNQPITGGGNGQTYYPYHSGDVIFIDGGQYSIYDGETGTGEIASPISGEVFTIHSFPGELLGSQAGLRHYYNDENVKNGQIYYYTVTSYSRPQPTEGVESLESGKTSKTYWGVPRSNPLGWQDAQAGPVIRVSGDGSALVKDSVISPNEVTGHEYEVGFRAVTRIDTILDGADTIIDTLDVVRYAYFDDVTLDENVLDSFPMHSGELSGPIIDGVLVQVAGVSIDTVDLETQIDTLQSKWEEKPSGTDMHFNIRWPGVDQGRPVPTTRDFLCTLTDSGEGVEVEDYETGEEFDALWPPPYDPSTDTIEGNDQFFILDAQGDQLFTFIFKDTSTTREPITEYDSLEEKLDTVGWDTTQYVIPPRPGDKFLIKTLKSTTEEDRFRFTTIAVQVDPDDTMRTMDDIRVVPNPYYLRAPWDRSQYDRHVMFQNLPQECTIRIFNTAGLLIRTIEHDGTGPPASADAGSEEWNLLTDEGLDCTSGLYIWQVETETSDGKKKTKLGKFAIIR